MHRIALSNRAHTNSLDWWLKICYTTPACQVISRRQPYTTLQAKRQDPTDVAVLGGGITGLASAYYLSNEFPNARIVLFEDNSRLGGWVKSERVDVGNGNVIFEQGPRNLRPSIPNGLVTLDLVSKLGLEHRLLATKKESAAAQNRFIYYPDRLVKMPGPGSTLLGTLSSLRTEPTFTGVVPGLMREIFQPKRPPDLQDESVGSFISRRFGAKLADNIVSAVIHGIYAGDAYQLSIRSILPRLWETEGKYGSLTRSIPSGLSGWKPIPQKDLGLVQSQVVTDISDWSVFTFPNGIGELVDAIAAELETNDKVVIQTNRRVVKLKLRRDGSGQTGQKVLVTHKSNGHDACQSEENFTHVISTIPSVNLAQLTNIPPLELTPSVTVMVVNLFYPTPNLLPVHGFGYLLPRSIPLSQNPECALGVVFDSEATPPTGQDTTPTGTPSTKLTVMLGGHWWDHKSTYPDQDEGARMAQATVKRHLGITQTPRAIRVGLHRNCIPQYTVGHEQRMSDAGSLLTRDFAGTLRVAGSSFTGVGVNDCIRAARDVVQGFKSPKGGSGLDMFTPQGRQYVWTDRKGNIV